MFNDNAIIDSLTKGQQIEVINPDTGRRETATVTGTGEHKDSPIAYVKFANGDEKYIFACQIC